MVEHGSRRRHQNRSGASRAHHPPKQSSSTTQKKRASQPSQKRAPQPPQEQEPQPSQEWESSPSEQQTPQPQRQTQRCRARGPRGFTCLQRCVLSINGMAVSFVMAAALIYFCFDAPIKAVEFRLPKPPELVGALEPNEQLTHAETLLLGRIYGPESIVLHRRSRTVYTGLRNGYIVKIRVNDSKKVELMERLRLVDSDGWARACDGSYYSFPKCGRPLGVRFHHEDDNLLLVADAYYGLYEVDLRNAVRSILKSGTAITTDPLSEPVTYFNDFDISYNGRYIVLSEPSQRFMDRDCYYALAEHRPHGRLLRYDLHKEELSVLIDGLQYPNGVEFDSTGECVFLSEMGNLRILRHCFEDGYGKFAIVISNLPGYPDNIRTSNGGMLWVPLGQVRLEDDSWVTERPWLRDLLAVLARPPSFALYVDRLSRRYGLLLLVDPTNGTIIRSFHDPTGETIRSISQVAELDDGTVLLGGDRNRFLGRFKPSPAL